MPTPLPISAVLLRTLRQNVVHFAHWKSNFHLAEALAGETDLDLLIDAKDTAAFRASMKEVRARRIISQPWASYPNVEDWLVFDGSTGGLLHLHVHYALVTGLKRVKHLHLPWTQTVLSNLRDDPASNWPIPVASLELLILLIRIWAKMPPWRRLFAPRVPSHIMQELRWLESEADVEEFNALALALGLTIMTKPPFADKKAILAASRNSLWSGETTLSNELALGTGTGSVAQFQTPCNTDLAEPDRSDPLSQGARWQGIYGSPGRQRWFGEIDRIQVIAAVAAI